MTLAQAKAHLNIPSGVTTDDAELTTLLDVASGLVEGDADRVFALTTASQLFDGGTDVFVLRVSPLASVTGVTVDGIAVAATAYDVDLQNGIVRTATTTRADTANVSIGYTAGSGTIPALAQHATLEALRHLWETQRGTGRARNARNGDAYTAGTSFSLPRRVKELLDPIRNVN